MKSTCSLQNCNKKLKMIKYDCKCGGTFCDKHRLMHSHNCVDLKNKKERVKIQIKENNPIIIPQKIEVI